ncbi:kinase-like domain-containing protein [Tirmania nivea]|nr:kinase-like domain-containing protein [Tirmania nivea]
MDEFQALCNPHYRNTTVSSDTWYRLSCCNVGPQYFPTPRAINRHLIRAYKTRQPLWHPIYKDSRACKDSPTYNVLTNPPPRDSGIVCVEGNSIDISEIEAGKELHDTCTLVTIKNDPSKKIYVLKTVSHRKYIRKSLMREMEILCTMPLHKNIIGRPSFLATVQWTNVQESFNAAQMPNLVHRTSVKGDAVVGYMTEYIRSGTLERQLNPFKHLFSLESEIALSRCLQLCEALIHLHRVCGLAHLGLKPDNVLVDTTDRGEFGNAGRIVLIDLEQANTWAEFRGPLVYQLDWQYRKDNKPLGSFWLSEQCDVHALACIFWMIFECKPVYSHICRCDGPGVVDTAARLSRIKWFHRTPISLRMILLQCTKKYEYDVSNISLEDLRDAVVKAATLCSQEKNKTSKCGLTAAKTATVCLQRHEPAEKPLRDSLLPPETTTTSCPISTEAITTSSHITPDTVTADPVHVSTQTIACSHEATPAAVKATCTYEEIVH